MAVSCEDGGDDSAARSYVEGFVAPAQAHVSAGRCEDSSGPMCGPQKERGVNSACDGRCACMARAVAETDRAQCTDTTPRLPPKHKGKVFLLYSHHPNFDQMPSEQETR